MRCLLSVVGLFSVRGWLFERYSRRERTVEDARCLSSDCQLVLRRHVLDATDSSTCDLVQDVLSRNL